jgi:hypothetical protein
LPYFPGCRSCKSSNKVVASNAGCPSSSGTISLSQTAANGSLRVRQCRSLLSNTLIRPPSIRRPLRSEMPALALACSCVCVCFLLFMYNLTCCVVMRLPDIRVPSRCENAGYLSLEKRPR